MSWTTLTPFVPYIRLALVVLALALACMAGWRIHKMTSTRQATPAEAVKKVRAQLALAGVVALLAIFITASSAHRPKDRIIADHSKRDAYLEQMEQAEDKASPEELKEAGPQSVDWETARSQFRSQAEKEKEQFERATSPD